MCGGLSRSGCDSGGIDPLGKSEEAEPDSSGFMLGVEGEDCDCDDRLGPLACLGRRSLIGARTEDVGRDCACDRANRDGDGDRIMDRRSRRRLSAMVVARSEEQCTALPRKCLLFEIKRRVKRDSFTLRWLLGSM